MFTNAGTKTAASDATRMSHAHANDIPAPAAAPFTAAMTGFSSARMARMLGWYVERRRSPMSPAASRNSVRSCPTQKPRPAPVTTTARTASSRASSSAALSALCIAPLNAFRTSGRLSVIVRTAPSRCVSTSAMGSTLLPQEEACIQLVGILEHEAVLARAMCGTLDLGDHGRHAGDLGVADDATTELAADAAEVSQLVAARQLSGGVEQRQPCRRAAAARRAVDLPVREDRDVALNIVALALPEDDAVHVAQLGLERVDDLVVRFKLVLELAPALDQPRQLLRRDSLLDGRVERAAERDVDARECVSAQHE